MEATKNPLVLTGAHLVSATELLAIGTLHFLDKRGGKGRKRDLSDAMMLPRKRSVSYAA